MRSDNDATGPWSLQSLSVATHDNQPAHVTITLGTETIFNFNGTTFSSSTTNSPGTGHNLVATDDFAYAEPQPIANATPILAGPQGTSSAVAINATAGKPFTGVVATFHSDVPAQTASSFKAVITWGNGHVSNGSISANAQGGFDVSGTNTSSARRCFRS